MGNSSNFFEAWRYQTLKNQLEISLKDFEPSRSDLPIPKKSSFFPSSKFLGFLRFLKKNKIIIITITITSSSSSSSSKKGVIKKGVVKKVL